MEKKPSAEKHERRSTIRMQHQKLNYASGLLSVAIGIPLAAAIYRVNPLMAIIVAGLTVILGKHLCSLLVVKFGKGMQFSPTGPFEEDIAGRSDEQILVAEFVRLGGVASSLAAAKLPNNVGNITLRLIAPTEIVANGVRQLLLETGVLLRNGSEQSNNEIKGLIGCGVRHMNPSFVTVSLKSNNTELEATVTAFAKEGLVKQRSGEEAATFIAEHLEAEFAAKRLASSDAC